MIVVGSDGSHLGGVLLRGLLSLGTEVGGGRRAGEVTSEDGLDERVEDKLGATVFIIRHSCQNSGLPLLTESEEEPSTGRRPA